MPRSSTGKDAAVDSGGRGLQPKPEIDEHHELARLRELFVPALPEGADRAAFAAAVRPATDPKFGDYQANGCMALAKALGQKPRDLAQAIADRRRPRPARRHARNRRPRVPQRPPERRLGRPGAWRAAGRRDTAESPRRPAARRS